MEWERSWEATQADPHSNSPLNKLHFVVYPLPHSVSNIRVGNLVLVIYIPTVPGTELN